MFEFSKEFQKELSVLLAKDFDRTDWLNVIGRTYSNVITGDSIGIIAKGSFNDAVEAGCNPEFTAIGMPDQSAWEIKNYGIYKSMCYDNLLAELKRGQKLYDLESNEAAHAVMTQFIESAFAESVLAKAFFASKDSSDYVSPGLQPGAKGGINGIVTQMLKYVADGKADASQVVTIATNTKAWGKTGTNAVDVIENLIEAASADVKASDNAVIIMTQAMYDCMSYDLKLNKGIYIQEQWKALFGGLKETTYNGYKVVVIPALDGIITKMVSGDKFYQKPLLAIMTTTDNLLFGSSSNDEAGVGDVDIFNDKTAQDTKAIVKFSLGAVVASPTDFSIAY